MVKNINKKTNLTKIEWLDAARNDNLDKELLRNLKDGKELLAKKVTYGKVIKKFDDVIVVLNEEVQDDEDVYDEVTVIPRNWITSPMRYRLNEKSKEDNKKGTKKIRKVRSKKKV